jgi:uncharacterized surface protein with fasciclin (FAS1) repeats/uncharacterized membrane-anchored protein YhcB (DUF1043 family)
MNKTLAIILVTLLTASALPLNASADATQDIPTNAAATGIHDSLVAALSHAGLVSTLQGTGPFTVFAPTDQAFADAGIDLNDFDTPEENATLSDILLHHVFSGEVESGDVTDGMLATMVNGDKVKFGVSGSDVTVGSANVTLADVQASNGVIHVIDRVLFPPVDIPATAQTTGIHNSLVAAVIQADLLATLQGTGPFTVFAPTDQAFTDAGIDLADFDTPEGKQTLADILLYHVVTSEVAAADVTDCLTTDAANSQPLAFTVNGGVMVNDANVTIADVVTSNGLIHVIDKVLMPSDTPNDIPRTAQCTGIHDSLVAGVIQAELLETLQGPGPFTVFAPTDQAFADAGIDLAALDTPEGKAALSDILLYHVVAGEVPAANVSECMTATAVNGQPLAFTVADGVMVNDANVTLADVNTSNGVIHVIDKVLTPVDSPNDIPRTAQCTGIHNSLVAAVVQAELLTTLQGTGPFTLFAPTDQAFTDAGIDLAALDTPEGKAALSDILLYHVVAGNVPSTALSDCMSAEAVNGQSLSFTVGDGVMVNGANVSIADVNTSNGVIHVIDKVLTPTDTPNDIPRTAQCTGVHNSLVAGVIQAELLTTLQGDGPFTVFAPTDQAFADAGIDLAALDTPEGKATLSDILLYHVLDSAVPAANVSDCMTATAVNGHPLAFSVGATVSVNGATITATDVPTSNGLIHVIDKVLMPTDTPSDIPATAGCTGVHNTLVAAVIQADLLTTLQGDGPFTLFAPTDQAFVDAGIDLAALDTPDGVAALSEILLSHVVAGSVAAADVSDCMSASTVSGHTLSFSVGTDVKVNGATVTTADVLTSNGIIHVIDTVLSPTATPNDIPTTAGCTGVHNSLVAAVIQADLLTTLQGDGPFTLFAPTDQAFTDAGIDLAALDTADGKTALTEILLSHVVAGSVPSSAVSDCMNANTVSGHTLSFTVGDNVMVNGATVTTADVMTSNGIIHVIDTVLTPTNAYNDITRAATCTGIHTSLVAALVQAELAETLQGEGPYTVFAPTDQAFTDAGIDLAALNTEEGKATLTDILLFHVYAGTLASTDITEGMKLRMLNGDDAVLSPTAGIEGANITLADVQTSNGVIHVIDMVLTPVAGGDETNDGAGTSGSSDEGGNDWILYIGIAVIVAVIAGIIVVRLTRRNGEDLESIQALGQNETSATQADAGATAYATTAAGYGTQATAQTDYQQAYQQQAYQPAAAQPAAAVIDDSLLSAFEESEPAQTLTAGQQTQAVAVAAQPTQVAAVAQPTQAVALPAAEPAQAAVQPAAVQPVAAQPVAAQPVAAAEPKVVNQWSDDKGHTWRVMSDGTNRWWNGTAWQKV